MRVDVLIFLKDGGVYAQPMESGRFAYENLAVKAGEEGYRVGLVEVEFLEGGKMEVAGEWREVGVSVGKAGSWRLGKGEEEVS